MKIHTLLLSLITLSCVAGAMAETDNAPDTGWMASTAGYEAAVILLVETRAGIMAYSGGQDFYLLRSLIIDALNGPTVSGIENDADAFSIRLVGDELDKVIKVGQSTIFDGARAARPAGRELEKIRERITDRLDHGGSPMRAKSIMQPSHKKLLQIARQKRSD